jgi:hypothetical protein
MFKSYPSRKMGMIHDVYMPSHKTTYDTVILRDTLKVTCKQTEKANIT